MRMKCVKCGEPIEHELVELYGEDISLCQVCFDEWNETLECLARRIDGFRNLEEVWNTFINSK
jgi:NMD protein affecting ribosome stability and mRNA decay